MKSKFNKKYETKQILKIKPPFSSLQMALYLWFSILWLYSVQVIDSEIPSQKCPNFKVNLLKFYAIRKWILQDSTAARFLLTSLTTTRQSGGSICMFSVSAEWWWWWWWGMLTLSISVYVSLQESRLNDNEGILWLRTIVSFYGHLWSKLRFNHWSDGVWGEGML